MKISISIIIGLIVTNTLYGQLEIDILVPDFGELKNSCNDSTLIDRVEYGMNTIYYEFQKGDTLSEYFLVNDSIYKFRQKVESKTIITGYYVFSPIDTTSSLHNPPGQYEQEIRNHINGELLESGGWQYWNRKITGKYHKGKKVGIWKERIKDKNIEISYKDDKVTSILNPSQELIMNYSHWFENRNLRICIEKDTNVLSLNRIEIVDMEYNCYTGKTKPNIIISTKEKASKSIVNLNLECDGTVTLKNQTDIGKYEIWRIGKNRINLRRINKK